MQAKSKNASDSESSIDSVSLRMATEAVSQPHKSLARVRIHDNSIEFAAISETHIVLCESRIPLGSSPDSAEYEVERGFLKDLSARSDGDIEVRADSEMIAFRSGDHVYSSVSRAEEVDSRQVPMPEYTVQMDVTDEKLRRLTRQIDAPRLVFSVEDGSLWISGQSMEHDQIGGRVRVPNENITIPTGWGSSRTMVNSRIVSRCLKQLPVGADCSVSLADDHPIAIDSEFGSVSSRHTIAPMIPGDASETEGWK